MKQVTSKREYCPVLLNLKDKKCVVVGGGKVALRKTMTVLECGGRVHVISPRLCAGLIVLAKEKRLRLSHRIFRTGDLKNSFLVFAASSSLEINRKVATEAFKSHVLVNVADNPSLSSYITPSSFRRGSLVISVSTSGTSPALARKIREDCENHYGKEYGDLTDVVGDLRRELLSAGKRFSAETWLEALDLDLLTSIINKEGGVSARDKLINRIKSAPRRKMAKL